MSKRTDDKFWKEFSVALSTAKEVRPKGDRWKKIEELMEILGLNRSNTSRRLMIGTRDGKLERFSGYIIKNGRLVKAVWYRQKLRA